MKRIISLLLISFSLISCSNNNNYSSPSGKKVDYETFISDFDNLKYKPTTHHIDEYKMVSDINIITLNNNDQIINKCGAKVNMIAKYVKEDGYYSDQEMKVDYFGTYPIIYGGSDITIDYNEKQRKEELILSTFLFHRLYENNHDFLYDYIEYYLYQNDITLYKNPYQVEATALGLDGYIYTLATYNNDGLLNHYYHKSTSNQTIINDNNEVIDVKIMITVMSKQDNILKTGVRDS